ncbi:MAG: NUDIX hydrolase [Candidatus Moranbacteria bacterium GW2011_GWF1_34_10]|nr:MAG: NUDIX hydrolase [Candidatus Moranbacteria bacterium GW2011_GWF1_34_10]
MTIEEYKKIADPLSQRTLVFLVHNDEVLLGKKKSGFGKGKLLGIGGSVEENEIVEKAMIREAIEEIGVIPKNYARVATLNFYFPYEDNAEKWNQQVCVYKSDQWDGDIIESNEILPKWFKISEIPFDLMWSDARYWLSDVLAGEMLIGDFLFDKNLEVEENKIRKVLSWDFN